jgi:cell division protein FtsI (penicillin-binding protein 3)
MSPAPARRTRILRIAGSFVVLFALLFLRAVDLAVLRGPDFARRATRQHRQTITLVPQRGPIVDRHGALLASSLNVPSIFMRPKQLTSSDLARLPQLAKALDVPLATLRAKVNGPAKFVWLKRHALPQQARAVAALDVTGVGQVDEPRRFYPHGELGAHVLGFVNVDSQGLAGVERRLDAQIRGEAQEVEVARDAHGRVFHKGALATKPLEGARVELTLDAHVQAVTERELAAGVAAAKARAGAAIVLDPTTGEVLALASHPTFNPNDPTDRSGHDWKNRARNRILTEPYEPGSTYKGILAAAALDRGVVRPGDHLFCENGSYRYAKRVIHDVHGHGWLTMAEAIQYSSNICATKIGDRLGKERYYQALRDFGFGQRTGIELPGEEPGILRDANTWARIDLATHSFGQGVSVTPLQLAAAFGAIANGGVLMRPFLVRRIESATGELLQETAPVAVRRVIKPEAARVATAILRRVVEERGGTGIKARIEGYPVAGKTGTAQKVTPGARGYSGKYIGSFVGYLPADAPRAVILVMIDEPAGRGFGGTVAAPVFQKIGTAVMRALGIEPETAADHPPPPAMAPAPEPVVETADVVPPLEVVPDGTPSFLGLSLREAMARAHDEGFDVRQRGSGWVVAQDPQPGTPRADDRRLALELRPDRGAAVP